MDACTQNASQTDFLHHTSKSEAKRNSSVKGKAIPVTGHEDP
jgi:hypothetical protein